MMNQMIKDLGQQAWNAREKSYSPYSQRKVGAAIRLKSGEIFTGCNIENASFGGTVCAERVAVWNAISKMGPHIEIQDVAVATDSNPAWPPCGFCRQVINEFKTNSTSIHLINATGVEKTFSFNELLPHSFNKDQLKAD
jgi:cytidine deaminase